MKNQSGTIKTNLELDRVVMGGSSGYRRLPGGSDHFSWHTDRQTLHHNIYIRVVARWCVIPIIIIRVVASAAQLKEKPGRQVISVWKLTFLWGFWEKNYLSWKQVVTFLLVSNLAMWLLNTLETSRTDAHPMMVRLCCNNCGLPVIIYGMISFLAYRCTIFLCSLDVEK